MKVRGKKYRNQQPITSTETLKIITHLHHEMFASVLTKTAMRAHSHQSKLVNLIPKRTMAHAHSFVSNDIKFLFSQLLILYYFSKSFRVLSDWPILYSSLILTYFISIICSSFAYWIINERIFTNECAYKWMDEYNTSTLTPRIIWKTQSLISRRRITNVSIEFSGSTLPTINNLGSYHFLILLNAKAADGSPSQPWTRSRRSVKYHLHESTRSHPFIPCSTGPKLVSTSYSSAVPRLAWFVDQKISNEPSRNMLESRTDRPARMVYSPF